MRNTRITAVSLVFLLLACCLPAVPARAAGTPWTDPALHRYIYCDVSLEDQTVMPQSENGLLVVPTVQEGLEAEIRGGQLCVTANPNGILPQSSAIVLSLGGSIPAGMLEQAEGGGFYAENHLNDGVWIIAAQCFDGYYAYLGNNTSYQLVSSADLSSVTAGTSPYMGQIYLPKDFRGYVLYSFADLTSVTQDANVKAGMVGVRPTGGVAFQQGGIVWDDFFLWGAEIPDNTGSSTPQITALSVSGAELASGFEAGRQNYYARAAYNVNRCQITAEVPEGQSLKVNGAKAVSGQPVNVTLTPLLTTVTLTAQNGRGEQTAVTLRIESEQNPNTFLKDVYRPLLHFTQRAFSLNDPNGLWYNAATGEYHLYFQSDAPVDSAYAVENNQKAWGHAVSRDLVSWREQAPVILPDENGTIWSGSCVVDRENTSGLFDDSVPPEERVVALFTYYGGTKPQNGLCSIGLAYSADGGYTFEKPFTDPVILNTNNIYQPGMRDPKVFWLEDASYAAGGVWVMVVAGGRAQLFTSEDLIHWQRDRELSTRRHKALDSECPDLYPLALDGDENNVKWIYSGGGTFYIIGELYRAEDGKLDFRAETDAIYPVNGISELYPGSGKYPELYAAQTFFNDASGRRIEMSWVHDLTGTTSIKPWIHAESLAMEVKLQTVNGEARLVKYPVAELAGLRGELLLEKENVPLTEGGENPLEGVSATVYDMELTVDLKDSAGFELRLRQNGDRYVSVSYNAAENLLRTDKTALKSYATGDYHANVMPENGRITLRVVVDTSMIDVFANGGQAWQNGFTYANKMGAGMSLLSLGGEAVVESVKIYAMRSMYDNPEPVTPTEAPTGESTAAPTDASQAKQGGSAVWIVILAALAAAFAVAAVMIVKKKKV